MSTASITRPWLSPPEGAEEIAVAAEKVVGWINSGELPAVNVATKVGGRPRWRIRRIDWEEFLARRANGATPKARAPRSKPRSGFAEFIPHNQ